MNPDSKRIAKAIDYARNGPDADDVFLIHVPPTWFVVQDRDVGWLVEPFDSKQKAQSAYEAARRDPTTSDDAAGWIGTYD